jgi:uncharacterized protein (TIGR03437 family)
MGSPMRILFALILVSAPSLAQVSQIQISMSPGDGIQFVVDGATFSGSATFLWPEGSKHNVSVQAIEYGNHPRTQYQFANWTINSPVPQSWSPTSLIVTADPSVKSVVATFNTFYELDVVYFNCPNVGTTTCPSLNESPGSICGISDPNHPDTDPNDLCGSVPYIVRSTSVCPSECPPVYIAAGSSVNLIAQPQTGYIFTGWLTSSGSGNAVQGFANTYVMNGPLEVYPQFYLSRPISIGVTTTPVGLQVLADHTPIVSPASLEWGTGTVHSLSVASPQTDSTGGTWVFSSWSDGGAQNHNYTVPDGYSALSLAALFVPAYKISFATNPSGLNLNINGKSNWPSLTFTAAAGTQYQVSAPSSQIDAQGRINQFVSWSNGGAQSQTYIQPANDDRMMATYQTLGHLTLISSPPGLSFMVNGNACVSPCSFDQPPGTQMNISVPASIPLTSASRLDFQGWQDSTATTRAYTMTSSVQTLSASYQTMFMVASATTPSAAGAVVLQPPSPDGFYAANTQLQATVSQNPGFQFRSWQGDLAGSQSLASLNISGPKSIGAVFNSVPYLPPAAVQNSAGSTPVSGVAPGAVVSIYGVNLASAALAGPASPLSQTLLNVTVTLGQQILPIYFVSPQQINVQLPYETPLGNELLALHQSGQPDVNAVFSVVRNAPGLFSITHSDGSAVNAGSPAAVGETLTITGTGFGPYDQSPPDGIAVPNGGAYNLLDPVAVNAGGISTAAVSAGPTVNSVGLNYATFQVPASLPSGTSVPLNVTINGVDSNQLSLFLQ